MLVCLVPISTRAEIVSVPIASMYDYEYDYTGAAQTFTAPYAGLYSFYLYGAQGSSCSSGKAGGYGGLMQVNVQLNAGDNVSIYVGGQTGYNGGGTGAVSTGGGATDIRINGNRIAIAGGGGGGTTAKAGGSGGATDSGDNNTSWTGSSKTDTGSAGGGGGYYGGSAGYKTTHTHSTSAGCYVRCTNTLTDGGYTTESWGCGAGVHLGECSTHGKIENTQTGAQCPKTDLTCTKTSTTTTSKGGSSWYNSNSCESVLQTPGVQSGNGFCGIKLLKKYTLFCNDEPCLKLYYDNVEVKKCYYNNVLILDNSTAEDIRGGEVVIF